MPILIIGDPHFKKNNMIETDILVNDILTIIKTRNVDWVILLGDVMHDHEKIDSRTFIRVQNMIQKISELKPLYILIGNHDRIHNRLLLDDQTHVFGPFKKWPNVTIVDSIHKMEFKNMKICMLPYIPDNYVMRTLESFNVDPKDFNLFFFHSHFHGNKTQRISNCKCDEWKSDFPLAICGHQHERDIIGDNLFYPGTPYQENFGESTDKGIFIMDDEFNFEMIELNIPKKIQKTINYQDLDTIIIDKNEMLKLTIEGPTILIKDIIKNPKYCDKLKNVKIIYKDTSKVKKNKLNVLQNMSFQDRLHMSLEKNIELHEIFKSIFN